MIQTRHVFWLCFAFAMTGAAQAAKPAVPLQAADFASGQQIKTVGDQAFYRLPLPDAIYTGTAYPDLRDIAVFNAAGEALPFSLTDVQNETADVRQIQLHSFEMRPSPKAGAAPVIVINADQLNTRVRISGGTTRDVAERSEYLLSFAEDLRKDPPKLSGLQFDWAEQQRSWQQALSVEGSDDLRRWQSLGQGYPLMDLHEQGHRLRQDQIVFSSPQSYRYWRLRFHEGAAPRLSKVIGREALAVAQAAPVMIATDSRAQDDGSQIYSLPSEQNVDALRITPAQSNSVIALAIEYRSSAKAKWQTLPQTIAYRLNGAEGEMHSAALPVHGIRALQFRLSPIGAPWGSQAPLVSAERSARSLVFNARGNGPYVLAWGNRSADSRALPITQLLMGGQAVDKVALAGLGEAVSLGGATRLSEASAAEKSALWQRLLLWATLIGGACGLGYLAWRLWREAKSSAHNAGNT